MYAITNNKGQYLYKPYMGFYSFTSVPNVLFFSQTQAANWLANNSDRIVYLNIDELSIVEYKLEDVK